MVELIAADYPISNSFGYSPSKYSSGHSLGVLPHELIDAILKSRGLSPYAAAKAMNRASFQPTLHKFLHGQIESPTRPTAKRIADFCKVPVEAIYDAAVATRIGKELGLHKGDAAIAPAPKPANEPVPIYTARKGNQFAVSTMTRIAALSPKQFKALNQMVLVYLDGVAPEAGDESGKRLHG